MSNQLLVKKVLNETELKDLVSLEQEIFEKEAYNLKQLTEISCDPNYEFMLVYNNQQLIGYLITLNTTAFVEIIKIAVAFKFRKQAIGSMLLKKIQAQTTVPIVLEVASTNTPAINFYYKHNFSLDTKRANYYGVGIDGLLLQWKPQAK